jgi:hypothetical protein
MLCVIPCLAPVPKMAQSYVVNLFIKIVFISAESVQMIFVAKNNYVFCPTSACYLFMPKCTFGELITIL